MKLKVKDTKSFIQKSKEIYGDLFEYDKTEYVTWKTPLILKCKLCGQYFEMTPAKHLGTLKKRPKHGIVGCPECNMKNGNDWRREQAAKKWFEKAKKKFGDDFDYSESIYISNETPMKILCKKCNKYFWQTPLDNLRSPHHCCPKCTLKRTSLEQSMGLNNFIKRSIEVHGSERYDFSNSKYINYNTHVRIYDRLNNVDFLILPRDFLNGYNYETNGKSSGEKLVLQWFEDKKFNLFDEVTIEINNEFKVRADFIIYSSTKEITFWIEYNGAQHYEFVDYFYRGKRSFQKQLKRDENVRRYCKENNIILIEIPYTYNTYEKISEILKRILIGGESPDIITQPKIIQPT